MAISLNKLADDDIQLVSRGTLAGFPFTSLNVHLEAANGNESERKVVVFFCCLF